jgi:cytochrome b6-f complex iron-sulfur subunit
MKTKTIDRKEFLQKVGAAALLTSMGISLISCGDDEETTPDLSGDTGITFDISSGVFQALQTEDTWLLHPVENILIVNVAGSVRAFTSVCTHSACTRDWAFTGTLATCTCHGSEFDNSGQVVTGPANRALSEFTVSQDGSVVTIK